MKSVFNAADTERHQRRRELRTVVLAGDKVELIRKAAGIGIDVESTTLHFKASSSDNAGYHRTTSTAWSEWHGSGATASS
jgi:hypothetical protein